MLGRVVKTERERRGWSQSELARRSGVTQGHIAQIESGKRQQPNQDTVERLAAAFGTSLAELYQRAYASPSDEAPPLELAQAAAFTDQELAEVAELWPYMTGLERRLLLATLRERAGQAAQQRGQPPAQEQPPDPAPASENDAPTLRSA